MFYTLFHDLFFNIYNNDDDNNSNSKNITFAFTTNNHTQQSNKSLDSTQRIPSTTVTYSRDQLMLSYLKLQLNQSREYCYHFIVFILISYQYYPLNKSQEIEYWMKLNDSLYEWVCQIRQWNEQLEEKLSTTSKGI